MRKFSVVLVGLWGIGGGVRAEEGSTPVAAPTAAVAPMVTVEVAESFLGTGVENRQIVGQAVSFDAMVGQVYFLTAVKPSSVPTVINHVWSVNGKEVASVPLDVKGSLWRTWSRKTVWPGAWKVEVKDAAGAVVRSAEFTVTSGAAPLEPSAVPAPAATPPGQP